MNRARRSAPVISDRRDVFSFCQSLCRCERMLSPSVGCADTFLVRGRQGLRHSWLHLKAELTVR